MTADINSPDAEFSPSVSAKDLNPLEKLAEISTYSIDSFCKFDKRYYVEVFDYMSQ